MQLRQPTRFVLGVGSSAAISSDGFSRRRARCTRLLRLLVSNPSFSKVLVKICCVAVSCGAMVADTKALTLAGLEKEEERIIVRFPPLPPNDDYVIG
jgi:hypothetical protein